METTATENGEADGHLGGDDATAIRRSDVLRRRDVGDDGEHGVDHGPAGVLVAVMAALPPCRLLAHLMRPNASAPPPRHHLLAPLTT